MKLFFFDCVDRQREKAEKAAQDSEKEAQRLRAELEKNRAAREALSARIGDVVTIG